MILSITLFVNTRNFVSKYKAKSVRWVRPHKYWLVTYFHIALKFVQENAKMRWRALIYRVIFPSTDHTALFCLLSRIEHLSWWRNIIGTATGRPIVIKRGTNQSKKGSVLNNCIRFLTVEWWILEWVPPVARSQLNVRSRDEAEQCDL